MRALIICTGLLLYVGAGPVSTFPLEIYGPAELLSADEQDQKPEKKGDEIEEDDSGFVALPVVYYTPETQLALGVGGMYYFHLSGLGYRSSSLQLFSVYTTNNQFQLEVVPELYWDEDRFRFRGSFSADRFVDRFFGIGNTTPKDSEEQFKSRKMNVALNLQARVFSSYYAGLEYRFRWEKITEFDPEGQLKNSGYLGVEPGVSSGFSLFAVKDSRDTLYSPLSGAFHQLSYGWFRSWMGSDFEFTRAKADLRRYIQLTGRHILALQAFIESLTGHPPFQMLALFGGQERMRGHYLGRYRDKFMAAVQAEYRFPLYKRFHGNLFAGLGDVAPSWQDFTLDNLKYSLGGGLRYLFDPDEGLVLRLDLGFARDDFGFYISVLQAF
jgi:outer membrane protein assembly factor BamA